MTPRMLLAPLTALASAALLAGCVVMPTLGDRDEATPMPGATAAPGPDGDMNADCDGGTLTITQPGDHIVGDCDRLTIEGQGIDVDAGKVGMLIIRGDDIDVDADELGGIDVSGQSNNVESRAAVGDVTIAGDSNEVEVTGDIGRVSVQGNQNEVSASGQIASITDDGNANEVRGDQR